LIKTTIGILESFDDPGRMRSCCTTVLSFWCVVTTMPLKFLAAERSTNRLVIATA
jgi:hypothetical protein